MNFAPNMECETLAKLSKAWRDIIECVPGYNPFDDAKGFYFDKEKAQNAIDFFGHNEDSCCQHIKGPLAGQPIKLEKWQKAIVANVFGWKHKKTGLRRYREVMVFVPRKNGKTTLAAGMILYVLECDNEPGAELYSSGADKMQASLIYSQASEMVKRHRMLREDLRVWKSRKSITDEYHASAYKALSADAPNKHGLNSHMVVNDELHAQPNRELIDVLATGTGARLQPIIMHITTSDYDREGSICNEKHNYACKVRDGIISDPAFFPVIYEAKLTDDWTDEKVWKKANPNLGISLSLDYMRRECKRAQETPNYENTFKRLHLNIRTEQAVRWMQMSAWDKCCGIVNETDLIGCKCYGGLDLASRVDIAAWMLIFPPDKKRDKWVILSRFFVPKENANKRQIRDRAPYLTWGKQGHVTLTEGNVIDYEVIEKQIIDDGRNFDILEIGADMWSLESLRQKLNKAGTEIVEVGQGFRSLSEPTKELEMLLLSERINHGGQPVLRWMASNASVVSDAAGNIKLDKKKSTEKIDGIVGVVIAFNRAIADLGDLSSVYEDRGLVLI